MSLINDALKKAQRDRTGGPAPEVPTPGGGPRPSESYRAPRNTSTYLLVGGGAVIGLVLAVIGVFLLRPASTPEQSSPAVATRTEAPPPKPASDPVVPTKVEPSPAPAPANVAQATPTPAVVTPPASEPAANKRGVEPLALNITVPAVSTPPTASPAEPVRTQPIAPPAPAVASVPATPAPPPPDPRVLQKQLADLVEGFRVAGIRAANNDSRVLMNDRVFRIGDTVDHKLGVKLTGVTANSLTFADGNGLSYTRSF